MVSATGYEQKIKDAPASITVITAEDFKNKRINSIADALVDVEGVDISPTAGKTGGLNIRIRGMDSEYTLVLIDGRRQNSTGDIAPNGFGESNNSFIPPISAIERIEVIRGPASTLYGSDAIGGVVKTVLGISHPMLLVSQIIVLFLQFQQLKEFRLFEDLLLHCMVLMLLVVWSILLQKKFQMNGQAPSH